MRLLAAFLLISMSIAGCLEPEPAAEGDPEPEIIVGDRPDTSYGDVETGPAVEPDLNATTAEAPKLVSGEWWRIRYDNAFTGEEVEVIRVVGEVDEQGYIFGMPHEGWLKEAISFHSPAFGDVDFDLSYNVHNERFHPVRFPLQTDATWETKFVGTDYRATVTAADEYTATIEFETIGEPDTMSQIMIAAGLMQEGVAMTLEYDARQHEIVKMESGLGTWEVIEHGYDFEGWVTVPRGEDTAIDYGVFGPASQSHTPMERQLTVDDGFNRMTMMHFVGSLDQNVPAYMEAKDVTPDGEEWITSVTQGGYKLEFFETNVPSGTWTVQDTVLGAGFTYHMGIAYFQYDIRLPDGARRTDHSHGVVR